MCAVSNDTKESSENLTPSLLYGLLFWNGAPCYIVVSKLRILQALRKLEKLETLIGAHML